MENLFHKKTHDATQRHRNGPALPILAACLHMGWQWDGMMLSRKKDGSAGLSEVGRLTVRSYDSSGNGNKLYGFGGTFRQGSAIIINKRGGPP